MFNVWYRSAGVNPPIAEWLGRWTSQWVAEGVFEILRPAYETGLRLVKQFALCRNFASAWRHGPMSTPYKRNVLRNDIKKLHITIYEGSNYVFIIDIILYWKVVLMHIVFTNKKCANNCSKGAIEDANSTPCFKAWTLKTFYLTVSHSTSQGPLWLIWINFNPNIKCGVKWLIRSQTTTAAPLKFGNE